MRGWWRGLGKDWILTFIIALVPAFIIGASTRFIFLGVAIFAVIGWLFRPRRKAYGMVIREQEDLGDSPPDEPAQSVPLAPFWRRYYRTMDRLGARRRRAKGGFRDSANPRRCIHCRYELTGLPDFHTCPECGRRYCFTDIDAYFDDPEAYRAARPAEFQDDP